MARTPFIAGNWKMNTNKASAVALAKVVAAGCGAGSMAGVDVGVAPPFVYLDAVSQALAGSKVLLGAQDVYFENDGAYTGEISLAMLRDLGVSFILTGHSERRHILGESPATVGRKAKAILDAGFILVHCVGEKLQERDTGKTLDVVRAQLDELAASGVTQLSDPGKLVIAYEPVWAIGTGRVATEAQAQEVHAFIRQHLTTQFGQGVAQAVRIQYGGSVKPENAKGLLSQTDIDGALVGGAALKGDGFLAIAAAAV